MHVVTQNESEYLQVLRLFLVVPWLIADYLLNLRWRVHFTMARYSRKATGNEKLSRKEKQELKKEGARMHEQIKTVRLTWQSHLPIALIPLSLVDCFANIRRYLFPDCGLCVHEDPLHANQPSFKRRHVDSIQLKLYQKQGPFHDSARCCEKKCSTPSTVLFYSLIFKWKWEKCLCTK